jgi:amidase
MERREFLGSTLMAGATWFTAVGARAADASAEPSPAAFPYAEWTLDRFQEAMARGELTSVQLTRAYLERIRTVDARPGGVNSVIELNPEAEAMALALDQERAAQGPRGPLHGIPVLIKDNCDTGDRMQTTAGSLALVGSPAPRDSEVARRLRAAGAVLLGKTNLSEWANFRSNRSISGWSGRGGLTRNPYALDRSAAGSSTGSGAAVSANFAAVTIGTETDGSIIAPANYCGIVGFKPTLGWVSRSGIIPIAASQDTAGPMTRTVTDAALMLSVLVGSDPRDPATVGAPRLALEDVRRPLRPDALRGVRVGVVREAFPEHPVFTPVWNRALESLREAGAELVDPVAMPVPRELREAEFEVMLYEFKAGVNAYLATRGEGVPVKSLADVIAFNQRNADRELALFGQETLVRAEAKGPLTDEAYLKARERCRQLSRAEGIDAALKQARVEVLVAPSGGVAHMLDLVLGDRWFAGSSTMAAVAGYPNCTVPCGEARGLPLGLSFFGRAGSDPQILGFAFAFEQVTRARRAPEFLATAGKA